MRTESLEEINKKVIKGVKHHPPLRFDDIGKLPECSLSDLVPIIYGSEDKELCVYVIKNENCWEILTRDDESILKDLREALHPYPRAALKHLRTIESQVSSRLRRFHPDYSLT